MRFLVGSLVIVTLPHCSKTLPLFVSWREKIVYDTVFSDFHHLDIFIILTGSILSWHMTLGLPFSVSRCQLTL